MSDRVKEKLSELEHYKWCRELDEKLALAKARHIDTGNPRDKQLAWFEWVRRLESVTFANKAIKKFKEIFQKELS